MDYKTIIGRVLTLLFGSSWKTSLVGYAGGAAGEVATYLDAIPSSQGPGWHILALVLIALGRLAKDSNKTGGSSPVTTEAAERTGAPIAPTAPAKASPPAAGFALVPALALVALLLALGAALTLPRFARADSAAYGGCLADGTTCFAPSVSLSLVAVSLKDGSVTSGVTPGLGYGVTWHSDKWYQVGASLNISFRDTTNGQAIVPSAVFSFANYARLGLGWQVSSGSRPFMLIGVGSDFGSTTTSTTTATSG